MLGILVCPPCFSIQVSEWSSGQNPYKQTLGHDFVSRERHFGSILVFFPLKLRIQNPKIPPPPFLIHVPPLWSYIRSSFTNHNENPPLEPTSPYHSSWLPLPTHTGSRPSASIAMYHPLAVMPPATTRSHSTVAAPPLEVLLTQSHWALTTHSSSSRWRQLFRSARQLFRCAATLLRLSIIFFSCWNINCFQLYYFARIVEYK